PSHPHSFPTRRSSDLSMTRICEPIRLGRTVTSSDNGSLPEVKAVRQLNSSPWTANRSDIRLSHQYAFQPNAKSQKKTNPSGGPSDRKSTRLNSSHRTI